METLDEITKNMSKNNGFFNHVFNFGDDSKEEMANIIQYAVLAIIPIVVLNKVTQRFIPEADEEKGNVELLAEVAVQIVGMFLGLLIIHRIITFIPTYSGAKYSDFNVTNIILAVLVIVLSLQTKLGEKVSILVERLMELWEGPSDTKQPNKKNNIKVSQPISQNQQIMSQTLGYSNSNSTPINQLPIAPQMTKQPAQQQQQQQPQQSSQEYMNMYRQENTMGAMQNGLDNEPMAANFGGSSFGSSF
jgi:hypothetical protein